MCSIFACVLNFKSEKTKQTLEIFYKKLFLKISRYLQEIRRVLHTIVFSVCNLMLFRYYKHSQNREIKHLSWLNVRGIVFPPSCLNLCILILFLILLFSFCLDRSLIYYKTSNIIKFVKINQCLYNLI